MTEITSRPTTQRQGGSRPRLAAIALAAAVTAGLALTGALVVGGAVTARVIPGIPDAGQLTRWALPATRLAVDLAAVVTLGALMFAAALLPSDKGALRAEATPYMRLASWSATGWALAAVATLIFTLSDILGLPPAQVLGDQLTSFAGSVGQGIALMIVVLLATTIALFARTTVSVNAAGWLLVAALAAVLPLPLTGHSGASPNHQVAITGVALHVLAVSLWVGGLLMLVVHALRRRPGLATAAARFSRLALWCYIAVGVTGVASAWVRLSAPAALFTTRYGLLIVIKALAFAALGYLGWLNRARAVPALVTASGRAGRTPRAGRRGALAEQPTTAGGLFARLVAVEAVVMAATMAVAVALARSAPPPPATSDNPVRDLIGYGMPPPITFARVLTLWRFDLFFAVVVVVAGGVYLAGVRRLRHRGDRWPVVRTVSWLAGLTTIVLMTMSGVGTYAPVLFSEHMIQHMVLSMLTPIFLLLGAPVTLALRALKPAVTRGDRGPREWLTVVLHSRAVRVYTHPLVATTIFMGSTYALYFTGLFEGLMRNHLGHIFMLIHFLVSGLLFFWLLIGVDPAPRQLPYIVRILMIFVTMPFHAFFGIALMSMDTPIAKGWYTPLHRTWGASLVADQHLGGALAWAFQEIPTLIVMVALVGQWARADLRQARRDERHQDRNAGTSHDELAAYNAYLSSLNRRTELP